VPQRSVSCTKLLTSDVTVALIEEKENKKMKALEEKEKELRTKQ